jgi:hypothetical protein
MSSSVPRRKADERPDSSRLFAFLFDRGAHACQALCAAAAPGDALRPRDYGKSATIREVLMKLLHSGWADLS